MTEQLLAAEIPNSVMKLERDDASQCCLSPTFEVKQEIDSQQSEGPMTHSASSSQHASPTIQRIKKEPCDDNSLCRQEGNIPEPWKQTVASVPFLGPEVATMTRYPSIIRTSDGASHKVNPAIVSPSTTAGLILPSDSAEAYNRVIFTETTASPRNYMTRQSKKRKAKFAPAAKFIHSEPYPHVAQRPRVNEAECHGGAALDPKIREWKEKQALWQSTVMSYDPGFNLSPRFVSPQSSSDIGPFYHERVRYPPMAEDGYFYARENDTVDGVPQSPKGKIPASSTVSAYLRQHESTVTTVGYQAREPVIKDVVSLATTQQQAVSVTSVGKRLVSERRRKSSDDGGNQPERPESGESGTSDNDESLHPGKYISDLAQPYVNIPDDHQVAHINGLLSLPSNRETRYGITYGELKRRCNPPESLTRVDLVAYVRHSKSSGRNLLDKYGIVSSGNRTSSPTVLSKMCENEARVLGDGILKMNMDYFPGKMLSQMAAKRVTERTKWTNEEQKREEKEERKNKIKDKMNQIEITRSMLKEIYDLLLSEKDSEEMKKFELASHTFGTANLMSHLTLFDRFFEDYQTNLTKPKKK